ncbi:MAG: Flp pilus assembly protein CpaB, partial [Planctomycetaceae bacterium]
MSRITPGVMTVVVFALLTGLSGAYVVRHHLTPQKSLAARPVTSTVTPETVVVPVALTDLETNRTVSLNDIAILRMTRQEYEASEFSGQTYLSTPQQIEGRLLKQSLGKGETFSPDQFYPFGAGPGILDRLQAGYRGVTIPVQDIGAVRGFARPGSFVDILFRSNVNGRSPEVTLTLFERVEILALDSNLVVPDVTGTDKIGSVTLAVTPQQAKILKVVEGRGELSLTLRHPDDDFQFAPFDPALERSLSGLAEDAAVMPASFPATAASKASSSKTESESIDGIDSVIGNASERLTLSDLLGISADPGES